MEILLKTISTLEETLQTVDKGIDDRQKEIHSHKVIISELQEKNLDSGTERKTISDKIEILTATNLVFKDLRDGIEKIPGVKFATKLLLDSKPSKVIQGTIMKMVEQIWSLTPNEILEILGKGGRFYNLVHAKLVERGWKIQTIDP